MLLLTSTVVSFSLADEVRDIKLCEITIHDRGGGSPFRPQNALQWAALVWFTGASNNFFWALLYGVFADQSLFDQLAEMTETWSFGLIDRAMYFDLVTFGFVFNFLLVLPGVITYIDVQSGNSPWRIFLLGLNALRRFSVIPMLAATVSVLVLWDSSNSKDMALNVVGALFLLQIDNEAFAFALPDHMRAHVEEYGRADIDDRDSAALNVAKTWTWVPMFTGMVLPVYYAKLFIDGSDRGWFVDPFKTVWFTTIVAGTPGAIIEVLTIGGVSKIKPELNPLHRAVLGVAGCYSSAAASIALTQATPDMQVSVGAAWFWGLAMVGLFFALDKRDEGGEGIGGRMVYFFQIFAKWCMGLGVFIVAMLFLEA
jgi:hypothetical protein